MVQITNKQRRRKHPSCNRPPPYCTVSGPPHPPSFGITHVCQKQIRNVSRYSTTPATAPTTLQHMPKHLLAPTIAPRTAHNTNCTCREGGGWGGRRREAGRQGDRANTQNTETTISDHPAMLQHGQPDRCPEPEPRFTCHACNTLLVSQHR